MKKILSVLALLLFVSAVVFAFGSLPPDKVYNFVIQSIINTERVKNVCVQVSAPGLYGAEDTPMLAILAVNTNWMMFDGYPAEMDCLRRTSYSAAISVITPNSRDRINRKLHFKNKYLISYELNDLVALPSRPVLLL